MVPGNKSKKIGRNLIREMGKVVANSSKTQSHGSEIRKSSFDDKRQSSSRRQQKSTTLNFLSSNLTNLQYAKLKMILGF